jgi:hypothetical protein
MLVFGAVMFRTVALTAVVVGLAAPGVRAAGTTITVLHDADLAVEEGRLVEALRIYTRDLACRVRVRGAAPTVLSPEALEQIDGEAASDGASIVLWAHRRDDGQTIFYIFDVRGNDLRETEVPSLGVDHAAIEVALKARALVVLVEQRVAAPASSRDDDGASEAEARRPSPVAAPKEPTATENVASPSPPPPVPPTSSPLSVEAHPVREPSPVSPPFALGAGLGLITPLDTTWLRAGVVVTAAVNLGRLRAARLGLYADVALTNRPTAEVNGFEVTLRDLPLATGLQATWYSTRTSIAVGSRTSLHVLDVDASGADGRTGASRRYTVGLGGIARGEVRVTNHLRPVLDVSAEGLVPSRSFTVAGQRALATGSILFGVTAGVVVLIP